MVVSYEKAFYLGALFSEVKLMEQKLTTTSKAVYSRKIVPLGLVVSVPLLRDELPYNLRTYAQCPTQFAFPLRAFSETI